MKMEYLLQEFCAELGFFISDEDNNTFFTENILTDQSDFNIVDGEEGDNGIIRYSSENKELLAVRTVFGGDEEQIEFTEFGKEFFSNKAKIIFNKKIEKLKIV